jgi:hypothetical protein
MESDSSVPCPQQPEPCTILSQIIPLHALPSFFLKISFNNITIRSPVCVRPSVWQTKFHTHTKLQFCILFNLYTPKYSGPNGSWRFLSSVSFESLHVGRDSSVGTGWMVRDRILVRMRHSVPSRPAPRPTWPPAHLVQSLFPGDKATGAWR